MAILYSRHEINNYLAALRGHLELWEICLAQEGRGEAWQETMEQEHNVDMIIDEHNRLYMEVSRICRISTDFLPTNSEERQEKWNQSLFYIQTWLKVLLHGCQRIQHPETDLNCNQDVLVHLCLRSIEAFEIFMEYIQTGHMATHVEDVSIPMLHRWIETIANPPPGVRHVYDFCEESGMCRIDKRLITLIQRNVEQNAYDTLPTVESGQSLVFSIRTSVQREKDGPPWLRVEYADNGPGIPQENLPHVFELFFTRDKPQGSGVGLALVSEATQQMGTKIHLTSKLGEGTVLSLLLPLLMDGETL